jgi:acyl-coenzyme A thioesterase PaaI-like protein
MRSGVPGLQPVVCALLCRLPRDWKAMMTSSQIPLNRQFIYPGNTCFGCGPDNPEGLRIEIHRDGERTDRLVGLYRPRATAAGFPGIAHGGVQFTALDCMAGWVMFVLRNAEGGMPLTTSAAIRFRKAARADRDLALSAEVVRERSGADPFLVHCEIRSAEGEILSEADYGYVLVPREKFQRVAGIERLPDHYLRHFGDAV